MSLAPFESKEYQIEKIKKKPHTVKYSFGQHDLFQVCKSTLTYSNSDVRQKKGPSAPLHFFDNSIEVCTVPRFYSETNVPKENSDRGVSRTTPRKRKSKHLGAFTLGR